MVLLRGIISSFYLVISHQESLPDMKFYHLHLYLHVHDFSTRFCIKESKYNTWSIKAALI